MTRESMFAEAVVALQDENLRLQRDNARLIRELEQEHRRVRMLAMALSDLSSTARVSKDQFALLGAEEGRGE